MNHRRNQRIWLAVAGMAIALTTLLMSMHSERERAGQPRVVFPKYLDDRARDRRAMRRQELSLLLARQTEEGRQVRKEDPFLVAISGAAARGSHMVIELEAFKKTPLGEIMTRCLEEAEDGFFVEFEEKTGVSPVDLIERVAMTDDLFLIQGNFKDVNLDALSGEDYMRVEEGDTVLYRSSDDPDLRDVKTALWKENILMFGDNTAALKESLGLLNGELPYDAEVISDDDAYGEIYGRMDVEEAAELFASKGDFSERFTRVVDDVKIHMDATSNVAIVAQVFGEDTTAMENLARTLGGILAVARVTARAKNNDTLAELLDFARVSNDGNTFDLELALPLDFLKEHMADCRWVR
jgi:hypothetical protein